MENHDKLYKQFQDASQKDEAKDFPNMENVWNRVEQKLDTTVLVKQNQIWKKIAIAASVILVVTLVFLFSPSAQKFELENQIVVTDSVKQPINSAITSDEIITQNPNIKPNAAQILEEKVSQNVISDATPIVKPQNHEVFENENSANVEATELKENVVVQNSKKESGTFKTRKFNALSVTSEVATVANQAPKAQAVAEKDPPLLIVNGKLQFEKNPNKDANKILQKLDMNSIDSISVLSEPMYIINGVRYSEKEVFGPNPTSPYSPLNKQEIETIAVLQKEKATQIYGEAGKNGIIIVTTKNGKPLENSGK